jgi:hypothetical protein
MAFTGFAGHISDGPSNDQNGKSHIAHFANLFAVMPEF